MIIIHYGNISTTDTWNLIDSGFHVECKEDWMLTDYAKECVRTIDKSEVVGSYVIMSPKLRAIPPQFLSGGTKTLIAAYMIPEGIFPLRNLGDNCAEMLYKGSIDRNTQWFYEGYIPKLLPEQEFMVAETGKIYKTDDAPRWFVKNAPRAREIYERYTKECRIDVVP